MRIRLQEDALLLFIGVRAAALHTYMLGRASHPTHVIDASTDDGQSSIMSSSRGLLWNDFPDVRTMSVASRCCIVPKGRIILFSVHHETHPCHMLVTSLFSLKQVMRARRTLAPGQTGQTARDSHRGRPVEPRRDTGRGGQAAAVGGHAPPHSHRRAGFPARSRWVSATPGSPGRRGHTDDHAPMWAIQLGGRSRHQRLLRSRILILL